MKKILILGDIIGRAGRDAVKKFLGELKTKLRPDLIIINGENSAGGYGITEKIAQELFEQGVNCITTGNHVWAQRNVYDFFNREHRILRPLNYPANTPGRGFTVLPLPNGGKIMIINLMGRLFMETLDDPFAAIDKLLMHYTLGQNIQGIIIDMHAEATSEKMALAQYLDGKVSAVVGTHTHMPTADLQILDQGTAYQSDLGMCGDYNSVIGMEKSTPILRFTRKLPTDKHKPAEGPGSLCGAYIEIDETTGKTMRAEPVIIGPRLINRIPLESKI